MLNFRRGVRRGQYIASPCGEMVRGERPSRGAAGRPLIADQVLRAPGHLVEDVPWRAIPHDVADPLPGRVVCRPTPPEVRPAEPHRHRPGGVTPRRFVGEPVAELGRRFGDDGGKLDNGRHNWTFHDPGLRPVIGLSGQNVRELAGRN